MTPPNETKINTPATSRVRYVCTECGTSFPNSGTCPKHGDNLASNATDPLIGQTLGPYQIAEKIGSGGMGQVYKGVHPKIGSRVAIKVLSQDCSKIPDLVERFFAEARAVNLIRHESIINIVDLSYLPDGRPYIVMEFLDGEPLSATIANSAPLAIGSTIQFILEVLSGLSAAHEKGVVHRDLKPENIFVSPVGRAKVLDFGIAKLEQNELTQKANTVAGSLVGTPQYMSPEQAKGQIADKRSDIYAIGIILFEALTGKLPFAGDTLYEILSAHVEEPAPDPRIHRPELPEDLANVILTCLAKDPEDRWQSVEALGNTLRAMAEKLSSADWAPLVPSEGFQPNVDTPRIRGGALQTPSPTTQAFAKGTPGTNVQASVEYPAEAPEETKSNKRFALFLVLGTLLAGLVVGTAVFFGVTEILHVASDDSPDPSPSDSQNGLAADTDDDDDEVPDDKPSDADAQDVADDSVAGNANSQNATMDSAGPYADLIRDYQAGKISSSEYQTRIQAIAKANQKELLAKEGILPNPNPGRWDVSGYLSVAHSKAKESFPDAELVYLTAQGVHPSGISELTLDKSFTSTYWFSSPKVAEAKSPKPLGVDYRPTCQVMVMASWEYLMSRVAVDGGCAEETVPLPSCTAEDIWRKAAKEGAPTDNAVADIYYRRWNGKVQWNFSIGNDISLTFDDDC